MIINYLQSCAANSPSLTSSGDFCGSANIRGRKRKIKENDFRYIFSWLLLKENWCVKFNCLIVLFHCKTQETSSFSLCGSELIHVGALFRKRRFALNLVLLRKFSKFAIFYVYEIPFTFGLDGIVPDDYRVRLTEVIFKSMIYQFYHKSSLFYYLYILCLIFM